ncbi:MAG: DUF1843 domain-containing protein [Longimicrobiaceae bacterium]
MHPVPPYGVAIQEAIASGDTARMQQAAQQAEEWLKHADEVRAGLAKLREHIQRRNG